MIPTEQLKRLIQTIWRAVSSNQGKSKQLKLNMPDKPSFKPPFKFDFSKPPFYTNTSKWLSDTFAGNIYKGTDLSNYGFDAGNDKPIKSWEKIQHLYDFNMHLQDYMQSWNKAYARKLKSKAKIK